MLIAFFLAGASCASSEENLSPVLEEPSSIDNNPKLVLTVPENFPELTYDTSLNAPTMKGFELGKMLFYDGRLSSDGVVSCGFCHMQDFAFTHHSHIVSHGVNGAIGTRNAPPLHNLAFLNSFNWDGVVTHLDLQPVIPITAEVEMNETFGGIIQKLKKDPEYVDMFDAAFENNKIDAENILKALSQFMIMITSSNSKFDKIEREEGAVFTDQEAAGFTLFNTHCASCHKGTLFTDQSFRNNGLPIDEKYNDIGRSRISGLPQDRYKFRVPNLRNIELTFPYMHDGRFGTLEAVLEHYTSGMVDSGTIDPLFKNDDGHLGLPLTPDEQQQIIAFLKTLTDDQLLNDSRFAEF